MKNCDVVISGADAAGLPPRKNFPKYAQECVVINAGSTGEELLKIETLEEVKPLLQSSAEMSFGTEKERGAILGPCNTPTEILEEYQYVLCDFLDEIEDKITRKLFLRVRHWTDQAILKSHYGIMVDTLSIKKIEYLCMDDGTRIRFDRVFDILAMKSPT